MSASLIGRLGSSTFRLSGYIHHCNVDVSHGLALLFGIGTRALPSWDPSNRTLGGQAIFQAFRPYAVTANGDGSHELALHYESSPGLIHRGPAKDEAEQSFSRPCRQSNGRTKRTYELTSSIVPRGTSFHRAVELWFSPIGFDPQRFSCCCRGLLPCPPELGAVNPDAVHDHGQPARQGHDRLFRPAAPGDLHGPRLEPGPFL